MSKPHKPNKQKKQKKLDCGNRIRIPEELLKMMKKH